MLLLAVSKVAAAALQAAQLRFRPIVMTSMAFGLKVDEPWYWPAARAQPAMAIGTGVLAAITGTVLAVIFVPVFFVVVRTVFKGRRPPASKK